MNEISQKVKKSFDGAANTRLKLLFLLMTVGIVLLFFMQVLWIRAEYRSAINAYNRETNLLFRSTMHQLTDSLIFSRFRFMAGEDTTAMNDGAVLQNSGTGMPGDSELQLARQSGYGNATDAESPNWEGLHGNRQYRTVQIRLDDAPADSSFQRFIRDAGRRPSDMRFIFNMLSEGFNADTVAGYFQKALITHRKYANFQIIQKEINWHPGSGRLSHESSDSLAFTTSFVPVGRTAYAASFQGVQVYLLQSLLPQIGFSVVIILVITLSFVLIFRSLKSQQRLIEQKNDFIGNVTHELKTPVATVGVALEAMKHFDVLKDPVKAFEYLDMATQELTRLGMMTDKILRTSVFDYQADITINKVPVDMKTLVEKVLASFRLLAEKKQISLIFEQEGDTSLLGNEEHLTQLVYNLVDNAMKYASDGPEVIVRLSGAQNMVHLAVIDRGPGIPEVHRHKIFTRFYRIPSGNVHNVKGYGLGLHYVKGVVRAHGGIISVESTHGAGATFLIKLPRNG